MDRKTIPRRWCNGNTPIGVGPVLQDKRTGWFDFNMEFQVRILGVGLTFFVYLFQIFIDKISSETFNSPFYRTTVVLTNSAAFYTQATAILAGPIKAIA